MEFPDIQQQRRILSDLFANETGISRDDISVIVSPSTLTAPAAISCSAFLLEAMPQSARYFCSLTLSFPVMIQA